MKKILVILNPSAGTATAQIETVHQLASLHDAAEIVPQTADELSQLLTNAVDHGARRIVIAGGDGSVSRVVNALHAQLSDIEFGITPLGTGNDLARSLDLPLLNIELAFEWAATRPPIAIDLIRIRHERDEYFVNAATAGFGAEVTAALTAEAKQMWGAFAYWFTATSRLADRHPYEVDLLIDGESLRGQAYGLTLANGRYIGGGFPVASQALLDDGWLNLVLIPVLSMMELMAAGVEYLVGLDSLASGIVTRQARQVVIRSNPYMLFSLDGEPIRALEAVVEVASRQLKVVAGERPAMSVPELVDG